MVFPPEEVLLSGKLGIVIVDMQTRYLNGHEHTGIYQRLVNACRLLIEYAETNPDRVRLYIIKFKGQGDLVDDISSCMRHEHPTFIKEDHDAHKRPIQRVGNNEFVHLGEVFNEDGIGPVAHAGLQASACLSATVAGTINAGYPALLPSDAYGNFYKGEAPSIPSEKQLLNSIDKYCHIAYYLTGLLHHNCPPTAQLLSHITSVWKRSQSPVADSPLLSLPSATALPGPSSAPLGLV